MKVADYKGYEIEFYETSGEFGIKDISGWFPKFKDATAKIDRVVKAEVKENFPIDAITSSMKTGKITSYNKVEETAWFTPDKTDRFGRERGKERTTDYSGKPRFYKATPSNLEIVRQYDELIKNISELSDKQRQLEKELTEPITFDTTEG